MVISDWTSIRIRKNLLKGLKALAITQDEPPSVIIARLVNAHNNRAEYGSFLNSPMIKDEGLLDFLADEISARLKKAK